MTTLMRNDRDRRSGKPGMGHARKERVLLFGTRSADYIRASSQSGCIQRPNTWLHPNVSLNCPIFPLHRGRRPYMAPRVISRRRNNSVASLIGRSGSSTFRLSTSAVSVSLTGSCFSSESAPGPCMGFSLSRSSPGRRSFPSTVSWFDLKARLFVPTCASLT